MRPNKVTAVILAAGKSSRMGQIKQLLPFDNKVLLQHVIDSVQLSIVNTALLILGFQSEEIKRSIDPKGLKIIKNNQYLNGMSSSIKSGLSSLSKDCEAVIFILGDQPLVSVELLNKMVDFYSSSKPDILIPTYKNKRGNPVLFSRSMFPELEKLQGDTGGRELFQSHSQLIQYLEVEDSNILLDVDTPADYQSLLEGKGHET